MAAGRAFKTDLTEFSPSFLREVGPDLAIFRRTGNPIAAWAVLGACARHNEPLPPKVAKLFATMSEQISVLAADARSKTTAREKIPSIVLDDAGKRNHNSVFSEYRRTKLNDQIIAAVDAALKVRSKYATKSKATKTGKAAKKEQVAPETKATLTKICEQVSQRFGVSADHVRRIFQQHDRQYPTNRLLRSLKPKPAIMDVDL